MMILISHYYNVHFLKVYLSVLKNSLKTLNNKYTFYLITSYYLQVQFSIIYFSDLNCSQELTWKRMWL